MQKIGLGIRSIDISTPLGLNLGQLISLPLGNQLETEPSFHSMLGATSYCVFCDAIKESV